MEVSRDTILCNEQGTNLYVYLPEEICRQACKRRYGERMRTY